LDAARIAATLGGAGVCTEAAAHAFGLHFLTLEDHVVELWVAERWREHPSERAHRVARDGGVHRAVPHLGGYDLSHCQ
jgi:hypothetical protein